MSGRRHLFLAVTIVGALVAIPCAVVAGIHTERSLTVVASKRTPARFQVSLASGEWELFEQTGTISGVSGGAFSFTKTSSHPLDFGSGDVQVMSPSGHPLTLRQSFTPNSVDTYQTSKAIFTGVVKFTAPVSGSYQIQVASPQEDRVIISRPPLYGLGQIIGWIVGAAVGAVALTVGLILFILALSRERKAVAGGPTFVRGKRTKMWRPPGGDAPNPSQPPWGQPPHP